MLAAFYTRLGPAAEVCQVGELSSRMPGPGEVRVRLHSSGVNPSDWKSRSGARGDAMSWPLIIPHSDGGGQIDAVGEGVPDRFGERVWIWNGQWRRARGTAAQFIVLPASQAVQLPDSVGYDVAACLGIPAFTALQAVRLAELLPGMTVLVAGGAGCVGHYIVQMAKQRGARVIATVSNPRKADHALLGGADDTINYRNESVGRRIKAMTGGGVDVVFETDLAANASLYPEVLRPRGTVVVYGMSAQQTTLPAHWMMRNAITMCPFLIYDIPDADRQNGVRELTALLLSGSLKHTVACCLPLEQIADAHILGEEGTALGKIVLIPPS